MVGTMGLACDRDGYDLRAPQCSECGSRGCPKRDRCQSGAGSESLEPGWLRRQLMKSDVDSPVIPAMYGTADPVGFDYRGGDHPQIRVDGLNELRAAESLDLTRFKLVYLGSPYTKYAAGIEQAFRDVSEIAAEMLRDGVKVYSPIMHGHPMSKYGNLDPLNHEIWLPFDQAMMDAAEAMVIADMSGWQDSYGVKYEIDYFRRAGKPVYFRRTDGDVSLLCG